MTEPPPRPRVSNRISPLAIIIVVILVGVAVFALVRGREHRTTPSGVKVPISAPQNAVMPRQPDLQNTSG